MKDGGAMNALNTEEMWLPRSTGQGRENVNIYDRLRSVNYRSIFHLFFLRPLRYSVFLRVDMESHPT